MIGEGIDIKKEFLLLAEARGVDKDNLAAAKAQMNHVTVSKFANLLGYPRFTGQDDPLERLANQPFEIVITTSPFTFIEDAFRTARKSPHTEVFRWSPELPKSIDSDIDKTYKPDKNEPLVYHLFGLDSFPDSLVLTEDDYLDFLGNVCHGKGYDSADLMPATKRDAFRRDLLVLGFSLDSWAFRVLYAGLIKRVGKSDERGVCAILLESDEEKAYLGDYLEREAKFRVFWGNMEKYTEEELRST